LCAGNTTLEKYLTALFPLLQHSFPPLSLAHIYSFHLSLSLEYIVVLLLFFSFFIPLLSVLFLSFYRIFSQPITFHLVLVRSSVLWSPEGRQEQITIKINLFLKIPNYIINLVINLKPITG